MSVPGPGTAAGFVRLPGDVETVLARSASTEKLFNPLKQKLLRKRIPRGETIFGAAFLVLLALVAALLVIVSLVSLFTRGL